MGKRLPNDVSKWSSKGAGLKKHAKSGVPHNHRNTIEMNREAAIEMQKQAEVRRKNKGKMYNSVKEVFKGL